MQLLDFLCICEDKQKFCLKDSNSGNAVIALLEIPKCCLHLQMSHFWTMYLLS